MGFIMSDVNQESEAVSQGTADRVAQKYVEYKNKLEELEREHKERCKPYQERMVVLQGIMIDLCKQLGVTSMRTPHGTIMKSVKTKYWASDWDEFKKFLLKNEALDLVERRIHQGNMAEFLKENPDKVPVGLNVDSEYTATVRRSNKNG